MMRELPGRPESTRMALPFLGEDGDPGPERPQLEDTVVYSLGACQTHCLSSKQ